MNYSPIIFTLPYLPRPKHESRSRTIPLKNRKTGKPVLDRLGKPMHTNMQYKSPDQKKYEAEVMAIIIEHAPAMPFDCPVMLTVKAFMPMPAYIYSTWKRDPAELGYLRPDKKPDLSNMTKGIEDIMTKAGFWRDDGQIVQYGAGYGKYYSAKPRWEIEVTPIWQPASKKVWSEALRIRQEGRFIVYDDGTDTPTPQTEDLFNE
jgi:Holliday junction resolvase RusA-like endonuclease